MGGLPGLGLGMGLTTLHHKENDYYENSERSSALEGFSG
jgi:hypothetical protein